LQADPVRSGEAGRCLLRDGCGQSLPLRPSAEIPLVQEASLLFLVTFCRNPAWSGDFTSSSSSFSDAIPLVQVFSIQAEHFGALRHAMLVSPYSLLTGTEAGRDRSSAREGQAGAKGNVAVMKREMRFGKREY
jgi:hypothetical protein